MVRIRWAKSSSDVRSVILQPEVTCYVIDADTSYNLLLGRPWIHCNSIILSTLHQVMKYIDEWGRVRMLIAEKHPFKVIENYFIDFLFYQGPLKPAKDKTPEDHDSGNEADIELEPEEECLWEIKSLVCIDKLNFDATVDVEGEWFINENLGLAYFSTFASNSVPSDTSTDVDSVPWSVMDALTSLHAPIKSSLMVREKTGDACKVFFEVPVKRKDQKPILFGRIEFEPIACESSKGGSESPQFFHYGQKSHHIIERIGYNFTKGSGLNFGRGKQTLLRSFVPKGKDPDLTTIKLEKNWVMYLRQSHQILNLKKKSVLIDHQQHHRGTQISASMLSSKVS